jgi:hypothetical protein
MECLICKKTQTVKYLDNYKLEIKEDIKFFENLKIYRCEDCDFSFVDPIPKMDTLNYFYKHIYRSLNRPPYWMTNNYEDMRRQYMDDKNLNYLLYLTTFINFNEIKNFYDFGPGYGDLGFLIKKKFPNLKLFCTEGDSYCKKILKDRDYTNFENLENINTKFDLIITLHSLEHLSDVKIFSKFKDMLNPNGLIFFEVPNCPKEYFQGRPYDSPHLLFFTSKSIKKIAKINNLEFINFSYSSYSFNEDHKFQRESQNLYEEWNKSKFNYKKMKQAVKKVVPTFLSNLRKNLLEVKTLKNDERANWFANNTGDNCYIRGILKKK